MRTEEIVVVSEGTRYSYAFGMILTFFAVILTIGRRGRPLQLNLESLLASIL